MEYLFDKLDVARTIFESRIDIAMNDYPYPDIEDEDIREEIRREARFATGAANIFFEEIEKAGIEPPAVLYDDETFIPTEEDTKQTSKDILRDWCRELGLDMGEDDDD